MNPVAKALWFIESHLDQDITLDDVADSSGVSRFHLSRAFGAVLNLSVMQYVRARRLSEAARRLGGRRARHPVGRAGGGLRLP